MNVTIIGAGNMARGIAHRLVSGGHGVTFQVRAGENAEPLVAELEAAKPGAAVRMAVLGAAIADPVVVLALPYGAAVEVAGELKDALAGKTVVDISNPLNATYDGLVTAPGTSAAETIAAAVPAASVVKAFNTNFAGTLVQGQAGGQPLDTFVAGDDDAAKRRVKALIEDGGARAIDAGPLAKARQLEALGLLGITLQGPLGLGFASGWKLVA